MGVALSGERGLFISPKHGQRLSASLRAGKPENRRIDSDSLCHRQLAVFGHFVGAKAALA
jgi:hypothetical protein